MCITSYLRWAIVRWIQFFHLQHVLYCIRRCVFEKLTTIWRGEWEKRLGNTGLDSSRCIETWIISALPLSCLWWDILVFPSSPRLGIRSLGTSSFVRLVKIVVQNKRWAFDRLFDCFHSLTANRMPCISTSQRKWYVPTVGEVLERVSFSLSFCIRKLQLKKSQSE